MGTALIIEGVDLYIPDVTIEGLEVEKSKLEKEFERIKEQLLILAATSPRDITTNIFPPTETSFGGTTVVQWEDYIQEKVGELLDEYYAAVVSNYVVNVAEENKENLKNSF